MNQQLTTVKSGFALQPRNLQEAMQAAQMISSSDMVPKNYQNKPQDTLVAMMMGAELGLNPIQSLQNIAVINGRPSIYGDALIALVQSHPSYGGHEEHFDDNTMTATCTVWRKGDAHKHSVSFSRADAEQAKLWDKPGPWSQYPKRMLMWRARSYAFRDKFADALSGLVMAEEAQDIPTEAVIYEPEASEPQLEQYSDERFQELLPKWEELIASGKTTAERMIAMLASKVQLTDDQKQAIRDCETRKEDAA